MDRVSKARIVFLRVSAEQATLLQQWLWGHKQIFLARVPHLTIEFHNLLENPSREVLRIVEYLEITPHEAQVENACAHGQPRD